MRRQVLLIRFEPSATPPSGDPPGFDVASGPGKVTLVEGDDSALPGQVTYDSHVRMTDDTHFLEDGELTWDGDRLRLTTASPGVLQPSAEEGTLRGAVLWQVEGTGRWAGATGLVSSSFETQVATGAAVEHQVVRLFLP